MREDSAVNFKDSFLSDKQESQDVSIQIAYSKQELELLKSVGLFGLGEAFINGEWQTNDLRSFLRQAVADEKKVLRTFSWQTFKQIMQRLVSNPQNGAGAFEVAKKHYDLGNDLFEAMLDSTLTYTCGYWRNAKNLDQAQLHKLKLLCDKLQLQPGMKVLDIGCGWGNFAHYAATNYGVSVVGLTVSKEQAALASKRCEGLPIEILLQDYQKHQGLYDCVVSIEMIEAVGKKNIKKFFRFVENSLKPSGLFALQVISADTFNRRASVALNQFILYLVKYIFPNGYLPNSRELLRASGQTLVLEDLHNFSADYEKTLVAWDENFIEAWPKLAANYDPSFFPLWRYYLCGCMAMFNNRIVQLYQIVYSKGGVRGGYNFRER